MKVNSFLQCRRQIFMSLSFLQKKSFWSLNAQITSLELLRTPILFSALSKLENARPTDAQKLLLSEKKLLNAILRAKLSTGKMFFLMKWTVFCNAEDRFSWVWAFLQKKSFWSLNAQNHFFRASKNTNSVFSATKQIMRMRGHRCSKTSFSVRKSC